MTVDVEAARQKYNERRVAELTPEELKALIADAVGQLLEPDLTKDDMDNLRVVLRDLRRRLKPDIHHDR